MTDSTRTATMPLTEIQAEEGYCCRSVCCGPGGWCCTHADFDHDCSGYDEGENGGGMTVAEFNESQNRNAAKAFGNSSRRAPDA